MPRHHERRELPYTAEQLFELIADIEKYPEFLEWFVAARIRQHDGNVLAVDQIVRFKGLRTRFSTRAMLDRPRRIAITTEDSPFKRFDQTWTFTPAPRGGTTVDYESELVLRSALMQRAMAAVFDEKQFAKTTVDAFVHRAQQIYGTALTPR